MSLRPFFFPWAAAAALLALPAAAQTPPPTLTLAQALAAARENAEVQLARHGLAAAQADVRAADHAPAPVLSAKAASIDLQNGVGSGPLLTQKRIDKAIGIDWTLERGHKRALRTQAAQASASAAQADLEEAQTVQLQAALDAYYELLAAQELAAQAEAIARDMAQLEHSARQRVQAGDLAAQDGARTAIEAERARSDSQAAALAQQQAALALAQRLGRSPALTASSGDWPAQVELPHRADLAALVQARAGVRAAQLRVQAAQAALDGAQALRKADVTLGASYDHFPGTSTRLLELRAQFPLQWGYQFEGEISRAQAVLAQAEVQHAQAEHLALLDLQGLQASAANAAERARSYQERIVPQARSVAQSAELAYAKGAIGLTDLLDARRTLRTTLQDAISARSEYAKARGHWLLRTQPQQLPAATDL